MKSLRSLLLLALTLPALAADPLALPRTTNAVPFAHVQAIPLPDSQVSFQRDGVELTRYYYGSNNPRPFLFPVNGPSGRSLTRMGHPHDPITHSHHNSVWTSHHMVNNVDFWGDKGGRIVHQKIERFDDGPEAASLQVLNAWTAPDGKVLLYERRRITVQTLEKNEWMLLIDLQFNAAGEDVTLGETAFGPIGVRMAKTIGVTDGGGTIRNSEGGVNEPAIFRKPARWCDYSGPITADAKEGITLLDHPQNPRHPAPFHVREDGWMGAAPTFPAALTIKVNEPLLLRYGLYIHGGMPAPGAIDQRWQGFAGTPWVDFAAKP